MAFAAVVEIRVAEGTASVVACQAALRARIGEVLCSARRGYLLELRNIAACAVAIGAVKTLPCSVFGVAKACGKGARVCRSADESSLLVTGAARCDVAPVR